MMNTNEELKEIIGEIIHKAIGLKLSDSELDQLSEGSSIKFNDLLKNRSLGEVGSTLIRIEALATAEQLSDIPQLPRPDIPQLPRPDIPQLPRPDVPQFPRPDDRFRRICFKIGGRIICLRFNAIDFSESLALDVEIVENEILDNL